MGANENLRSNRMAFYEGDIDRINGELDGFLELSGARATLLIDREGHLVTRRGESIQSSAETISALVAGSFAATREMARLLGEDEFATMFHQGQRDNIQISMVGERSLLAIVFDDRTNLGLVRFYAQECTRRLRDVMNEVIHRSHEGGPTLADDFSSSAAAALDELF